MYQNAHQGGTEEYAVYTLRYTWDRLRSTPIVHLIGERCAKLIGVLTGVLLIGHLDSRCIIGVEHLGRGVLLDSLWANLSRNLFQNHSINHRCIFHGRQVMDEG